MMNRRELDRDWLHYEKATREGQISSLHSLGLAVGRPQRLGLSPAASEGDQKAALQKTKALLLKWESQYAKTAKDGKEMSDEQKLFELGMQFLRQAEVGPVEGFRELLEAGVPIDFQHPRHLYTALHMAAAGDTPTNRELVKILLEREQEIDFLIEDEYGRIPWHNAIFFGLSEELRDRILAGTRADARIEGIDLEVDFKSRMKEWMHSIWYRNLCRAMGPLDIEP